ncbi:MAG TPA: TIGR04219 family outer membrane beta-barrel protein, partial [Pseudodesulfovibrio sp.]|nr:TIGR04219 family outer membrane beta-barrel protein [Pseudodesulfovibrio sp.]
HGPVGKLLHELLLGICQNLIAQAGIRPRVFYRLTGKGCLAMKTGRLKVVIAGLALCVGPAWAAHASPTLDFGVSAWNAQATGQGTSTQGNGQNSTVDLQNDLGMQREWTGGAHLIFRHDLPVIPDFLVETNHLINDGNTILNRDITWQGTTYQANGPVQSQVDLKMARLLAFWNPLDNPLVNLRLGVEARWLNLNIPVTGTVQGPTGPRKESVSAGGNQWLPLGNVGLTLHLPADIDLGGEWSYVRYSGSYLSDYRVQASYTFGSGIVLFAGWRHFHLNLDNSSFTVRGDLDFKGIYTGIGFAF